MTYRGPNVPKKRAVNVINDKIYDPENGILAKFAKLEKILLPKTHLKHVKKSRF